MRTFIIILCILLAAVAAMAVYLVVTTPKEAVPLRFPLTAAQQELLGHVPADAEAYALVPAPVVLMAKLEANPMTREPVTRWAEEHPLPPAAMLGRADAVAWRSDKTTAYAVRFDPVRALIARAWTMFASVDAAWHGQVLIIGAERRAGFSPPGELQLANGLPEGDVFVVQRKESRGAFPPMGRPAVTSVKVSAEQIEMTSRAATDGGGGLKPALHFDLPRGAMLSVSFTEAPRLLGDLERLIASDVDALVGQGGVIALYGVDTGTLLPRPFGAIVVPANDASRAAAAKYGQVLGEVRESGGQLVIPFDRNSATQYLNDAKAPSPWPANRWALRMDPTRLIPVLRKAGDNPALRFAAPRIYRGARDLRRWMGTLEQASSVEAAASVNGEVEELRVRVASK
ncbi:MAG TPA: hypothetical protein VND45_09610 [Thermoanaerobaculia bacterium]|jgi:hypothetical protein|nr:hypothetical protein [Thermoanaerobaculia bacterium]